MSRGKFSGREEQLGLWQNLLRALALGGICLGLAACDSPEPPTDGAEEEAAQEVVPVKLTPENILIDEMAEDLRLQGPPGFITPALVAEIQQRLFEETGVEVTLHFEIYESELGLVNDLQTRTSGDLVLLPNSSVPAIQKMGLLQEFRLGGGEPVLYSPYQFSALGLLTRGESPEDVSWKNIFRTDNGIYWLCRPEDVVSAAFLALQYSPNQLETPVIEEVTTVLRESPALIGAGADEAGSPAELLEQNRGSRVITFSHEAPELMEAQAGVGFAVPQEGSIEFQLGWVVPRHAASVGTAEQLLVLLQEPELSAAFARHLRMTPARNPEARDRLRNSPEAYLPNILPATRTYYDVSAYGKTRAERLGELERLVVSRSQNVSPSAAQNVQQASTDPGEELDTAREPLPAEKKELPD